MCLTYESALSTLAPFVTQFCSTKQLLQSYVTTPLKNKSSNQKNFSFKFSEFKRSLRLVIKMLITLPKCQLPLNVLELCFGRFETVVCRNINNKDKCLMDFCKEKITVFPAGTLFAKALMSAKLLLSVCQRFGGLFSCSQFTCPHTQKHTLLLP